MPRRVSASNAHRVTYRQRLNLPSRQGREFVALPKWRSSVARVNVNGQHAGYIVAPPWKCEVTQQLQPGHSSWTSASVRSGSGWWPKHRPAERAEAAQLA